MSNSAQYKRAPTPNCQQNRKAGMMVTRCAKNAVQIVSFGSSIIDRDSEALRLGAVSEKFLLADGCHEFLQIERLEVGDILEISIAERLQCRCEH